ncbi:unnamed protein product [Adineta steineri]|uniref:Potassium channel tetramerisation-type BTB domain-containing protein n=1 Tax=Adineta steineri TaxID=433720 RepID=A0A814WIL4_9BILA|nr:unnamed protein product [Adineta steineri]CAF3516330.1 unnamed protein product [Adineta steineri]
MVYLLNNDICIKDILADTTTSASILSGAMTDYQKQKDELTKAQEQFKTERDEFENEKKIMEKFLKNSDVIQFNVGGEIMFTSRASLLHVANSTLSKKLLGKSKEKLSIDKDGNIFLDFNPKLFRHLLEQLRLFEDGEKIVFYPPLTPILTIPFNNMLEKLGLTSAPISDDDIFTFNVGDEIIATKRKTLNRIPNSKLSTLLSMNKPSDMDLNGRPFLDYDPKLFRHLLTQLQSEQTTNFEAPSIESKTAFNAMLNNLGLKHK